MIIVTRRGRGHLEGCLRAVFGQRLPGGFEVVLVDNGSEDGSVDRALLDHPSLRVVRAGRNLGFAGGNNLGLRESAGEFPVLLNDDTRVRSGWLAALVEAAEAEPRAGAVGSLVVFQKPAGTIDSAGLDLLDDGAVVGRGTLEPAPGQPGRREEVFAACGNGMLLRRAALERVGCFDEAFFAYFEDADLCWRMRLAGWTCWLEPAAVVDHLHAATAGVWSDFYHFQVRRNRLLVVVKNAPPDLVWKSLSDLGGLLARSLARAAVRRVAPDRASPDWPTRTGTRTQFQVIGSLLRHLPGALRQRRAIRGQKRVSDREIRAWMRPAAAVYARPHRIGDGSVAGLG